MEVPTTSPEALIYHGKAHNLYGSFKLLMEILTTSTKALPNVCVGLVFSGAFSSFNKHFEREN